LQNLSLSVFKAKTLVILKSEKEIEKKEKFLKENRKDKKFSS